MTDTKKLIKDFKAKYEELAAEIKAAQDKIKADSQQLINQIFEDYFSKYGDIVYAIHWTQGTPSFNDGEACEFSVHDMYLSFTEEGYEDGEGDSYEYEREDDYRNQLKLWDEYDANPEQTYTAYVKQFNDTYSGWRHSTAPKSFNEWTPTSDTREEIIEKLEHIIANKDKVFPAMEEFKGIEKVISTIDDQYLEMVYGDNSKITYFGPDGRLEVDDWDCGY